MEVTGREICCGEIQLFTPGAKEIIGDVDVKMPRRIELSRMWRMIQVGWFINFFFKIEHNCDIALGMAFHTFGSLNVSCKMAKINNYLYVIE